MIPKNHWWYVQPLYLYMTGCSAAAGGASQYGHGLLLPVDLERGHLEAAPTPSSSFGREGWAPPETSEEMLELRKLHSLPL